MRRRRYLGLVSSVAVAAAAGCSSDSMEQGDGETTTGEETATPAESLDAAATALNEAYDGIERQSDAFGEEGESFDENGIRQSLSEANEHLDAAEGADLSADQRADVEDMRNAAAFLGALTDAMVEIDAAFNEQEVAQSYVDTERFEDGIETLDDARSAFRDASDELSEAETEFEALDDGSFERIDGTTYAEVEDSLSTTSRLIDMMDPFLTGYREFVRGYERFSVGTDAVDAERYRDAASEYDTAAVRFDGAESAFMDAEDAAPPEMRSDVIELTCLTGALADASRRFAAGTRALDDGDRETANEEFEAAQTALDRCDSDSAALATPAL